MAPHPRPFRLHHETTSPRFPSRSRSDVAGPPAGVVVCPHPASRQGIRCPTPSRHPSLPPPADSGRIDARWQGALSALCQRPEARLAVPENGPYVIYALDDSSRPLRARRPLPEKVAAVFRRERH